MTLPSIEHPILRAAQLAILFAALVVWLRLCSYAFEVEQHHEQRIEQTVIQSHAR